MEAAAANAATGASQDPMNRTMPARLSSTPSLPSLAMPSSRLATPVHRAAKANVPTREAFLGSLLNEDLQKVTKWHGTRPHHEQKRFLRSVNTLYNAFTTAGAPPKEPSRAQQQREAEAAAAAAAEAKAANVAAQDRAAVEDPLNGPPRDTPRGNMFASASEPSLGPSARPIDVMEMRKQKKIREKRTGEDPNTLMNWLEGASLTSHSTATTASTSVTRFSALTATSIGASSICSEPGTTHQMQFRHHKRAYAANRPCFKVQDPHSGGALQDGVPHIGYPPCERFNTHFQMQYGKANPLGQNITKEMYSSVFKGDQHQFVSSFLETAPSEHKDQFTGLVRSLEYLRTCGDKEIMSMQKQEMNLKENQRLFKPSRQRAMFDPSEINISQVPLGTLNQVMSRKTDLVIPEHLPVMEAPPSPSVSGLGSLPLSRLTTPALSVMSRR
jgi:hypothetical protein